MRFKGMIFDLDGTVANTIEDIALGLNLMLEDYGFLTYSVDEVRKMIGNGARNLVTRSLPEDKKDDEAFVNTALVVYQNHYSENCLNKVCIYEGLTEVLKKLKCDGVKLAVVTNKDMMHATRITDKLLPGVFDIVYGYNGNFPHKPNPSAVYDIMDKLNLAKEDTAFVGDTYVDVQTGRNAGVKSIGVCWGFNGEASFEKEKPDFMIHRPEELLTI